VSPRYFETIGTRVSRGREFTAQDTPVSRPAAVVNEAFARRYFPLSAAVDPLGRTFRIDSQTGDVEIVGVVEDAKYDEPRADVEPMVFLPLLQMRPDQPVASGEYHSNFIGAIEIRSAGDPAALAPGLRRVLAEIDPALPVTSMATIAEHIGEGLSRDRMSATLAAIFGFIALALTCVGVYGVMAYLVQRRTAEIGLRIALGAARGSVVGAIIREVLAQAVIGIAIGLPAAYWALRLIATQLYGVIDIGPGSLVAIVGLLLVCLGLAGYVPARRASRLDPAIVLRAE
jgi:predicted permease